MKKIGQFVARVSWYSIRIMKNEDGFWWLWPEAPPAKFLRRISAKILSKILPQKAHDRDIRDKSAYLE